MKVKNKRGDSDVKVNRKNIKFMECSSDQGKIVINNSSYKKQFNLYGDGDNVYIFEPTEGRITIYLEK